MTIQSTQVGVSTVPVLLGSGAGNGITITVYNATGPTVYLGGGTAVATSGTASGGLQLAGTQYLSMEVQRGDTLYAVAASGTATVHVLRGGV
jgi:hypothetical protein